MCIAAQIDDGLSAIHTDQLNTPRQLTDESGQKVWQWAISGFGEVEPTTAQTGWIRPRNDNAGQRSGTLPVVFNLRFPGQQFDEETGLHYNHHRYYDPYLTVGYTEADPLGLQAGWNRFAYVDGDPLEHIDIEGLMTANKEQINTVYYCSGILRRYEHAYICIGNSCAGLMPPTGGSLINGQGEITIETMRPEFCRPMSIPDFCSQEAYENCIKNKINSIGSPHPYGLITYNCVSWARGSIIQCQQEACKRKSSLDSYIRSVFR